MASNRRVCGKIAARKGVTIHYGVPFSDFTSKNDKLSIFDEKLKFKNKILLNFIFVHDFVALKKLLILPLRGKIAKLRDSLGFTGPTAVATWLLVL